jgi:Fic family protein
LSRLFQNPIIDVKAVVRLLGIAPSTANRLVIRFIELGILEELTGYKRIMYNFAGQNIIQIS